MKKYILIFVSAVAVLLIAGDFCGVYSFAPCGTKHDHEKHDHAHEKKAHTGHSHAHEHGAEEGEGIHLSPEQLKHTKLTVSKASAGSVGQKLELHGEIKLNSDRTSKIMQRVPGFVTLVCAKQGDRVKKGQLLARLTSEKLGEYYSHYYSAKALEEVALSEYNMAKRLFANKAMAEKEYLRYKRDYIDSGISRRKAETILRSLELDPAHREHTHGKDAKDIICTEYDIVSPIGGTVVSKDISVGEKYADDNTQVLFTVSDLDRLWLELKADFYELKAVKIGMKVEVTAVDQSEKYPGRVIYVSDVIDEASRKGTVRVELEKSAGKLRSGEFAIGKITLDSSRKSIVMPREAVQLISGESVLFVPAGKNFVTRVVKTGDSNGREIEILSGISAGEEYVSEGAFSLKAIMLTAGMDPHAGHGH